MSAVGLPCKTCANPLKLGELVYDGLSSYISYGLCTYKYCPDEEFQLCILTPGKCYLSTMEMCKLTNEGRWEKANISDWWEEEPAPPPISRPNAPWKLT